MGETALFFVWNQFIQRSCQEGLKNIKVPAIITKGNTKEHISTSAIHLNRCMYRIDDVMGVQHRASMRLPMPKFLRQSGEKRTKRADKYRVVLFRDDESGRNHR